MFKSVVKQVFRRAGYDLVGSRAVSELRARQREGAEAEAELAHTREELARVEVDLTRAEAELAGTRAKLAGYQNAYEVTATELGTARAEADGYKRAYETVCCDLSGAQVLLKQLQPHGDLVKEAVRALPPPTRRLRDTPGLAETVQAEATRLGLPEVVVRRLSDPDFSVEDPSHYRRLFSVAKPPLWDRVGAVVSQIVERQYLTYRPRSTPAGLARATQAADTLKREGYVRLDGLLTPEQVRDIQAYFRRTPVYNGHTPETARHRTLGRFIGHTAEDFPLGSHTTEAVANAPHVLETALSPFVLDAAAAYLGCTPQLSWLQSWWNFQGPGDYPHRQHNYHRDANDFRMFWVYVYLSDVAADSGPHRLIRRSADFDLIRDLFPAGAGCKPEDIDNLLHSKGGDAGIEGVFGDLLEEVTGPAGTAFLSRGIDLHKVCTPLARKRQILALRFTMTGFPNGGPDRDGDPVPGHVVADRVGDDECLRHVTRLRFDWTPRPAE